MTRDRLLASVPRGLLIGPDWRAAGDGATLPVIDPATEEVIANVASATPEDAVEAVAVAAEAMRDWARVAPRGRSEILRRAYELMCAQAEDLAVLIALENGKALPDARGEVRYAAEFLRWYAEEAVRLTGSVQTAPTGDYRILVEHQPIGVAVLVTPWNFPAAMATRKIGPALAAGCAVVLKPASDTPLTALAMGRIFLAAGVPPGVVNVLPSRRSGAVVKAMLAQEPVRKISFTGSTEVGRVLLANASERVQSTSMELGGNAAFLVFGDADVDAAVRGAMVAKMRNGGEACTAANRFYVHESVADAFVDGFARAMAALRIGAGYDEGTELGPLINAEARTRIEGLVDEARVEGARVVTGAQAPQRPGYFYAPTVLDHVAPGSRITQEEIFGPVAPVLRFRDPDEAIAQANATEYGLVSYLYTRDLAFGMQVAERLESGMVGLNRGLVSDPSAPFGGVKQSGLGREGGHEGMLEYTEKKYIAVAW